MIAVVVVSHGLLASELLRAAERVMGPQENVATLGLWEEESPASFRERLRETLLALPECDGTLVLVDLFGGTPYNTAMSLDEDSCPGTEYVVVSGVNLAMLLKALEERQRATSASALAETIARVGADAIRIPTVPV